MKQLKSVLLLLLAAVLCLALFACADNPDNPGPSGEDTKGVMVMVAAYKNNAVVDGKLLITDKNEYAFIPYGKEIKASNVVKYTYEADISSLVGVPAKYEVSGGKITNVIQDANSISYESSLFDVEDGAVKLYNGNDVLLSSPVTSEPQKYYFVFDGMHFASGSVTGSYGFDMENDDVLTLYDIDGDGTYDYVVYTPVYNALTVTSVKDTTMSLSGGYGSAAWLDIFADGSGKMLHFKKSLSQAAPSVGDLVNVTVKIDCSLGDGTEEIPMFVKVESTTETKVGYLNAAIWNSETDIMSRIGSYVMHWSTSLSDNDAAAGRGAVKSTALGSVFEVACDEKGYVVYAKTSASSEIDAETTAGYTTLETENGTEAAALLDVQGLWHKGYTYSKLSTELNMLYNIGIRRVYVVCCNPGYPMFSWPTVGYSSRTLIGSTDASFKVLGFEFPDYAIAEICHDKGMSCYAVYKPYEGGGIVDAPTGGIMEEGKYWEPGIFGQRYSFEDFIVEMLKDGKDYRVCRRPDGANDNLDGVVDRITVDFVAGAYKYRANSARRTEVSMQSAASTSTVNSIANGVQYSKSRQHPTHGINLWTSPDNFGYSLYEGDYKYTYKLSNKVLYDCNGDPLCDGEPVSTITLEITYISIEDHFCAVTFDNTTGLRTDPLSLIHLWSGDRKIVTTSTDCVRNPGEGEYLNPNPSEYIWGRDLSPGRSGYSTSLKLGPDGKLILGDYTSTSDNDHAIRGYNCLPHFPNYGFAFNFEPYPGNIRGNNCVIAIGRGKIDTFPGGLCEGYEEVREYWLSHLETILNGSFDGVVIRLQAHSSIATDFKNYGFNEPIVEKYKELYGQEAYNTLMDLAHSITDEEYIRIMRIRGDFFTLFLDEASELCHKYGAEFSVTLRDSQINPEVSRNQNEVTWWTMPKIVLDWKHVVDISDFVVIKDYIFNGAYISRNALEIKEYATSQNKKVWMEAYDDQGKNFTTAFFSLAIKDENTGGILLYELTDIVKYYSNGLKELLAKCGFELKTHEDVINR